MVGKILSLGTEHTLWHQQSSSKTSWQKDFCFRGGLAAKTLCESHSQEIQNKWYRPIHWNMTSKTLKDYGKETFNQICTALSKLKLSLKAACRILAKAAKGKCQHSHMELRRDVFHQRILCFYNKSQKMWPDLRFCTWSSTHRPSQQW